MKLRSLRLRLSLAAAGLIALALALAGAGLVLIFDRVLDARTAEDLDRTAKFLAGQVSRAPDGRLQLGAEPADPRLATPYGGLYWQIAPDGPDRAADLHSRSLWDKSLPSPPTDRHTVDLDGPEGARLIAVGRRITIGREPAPTPLTITVAMDRRDLAASRTTFLGLIVPALVGLGLVLALAMSVFVQRALRPFRALRTDLRAIHDGARTTLPGDFPDEVQPLVDDLNRLIGVQERALQRARTQAGDMAHGLKTPLAVLTALARHSADDRPELSAEIEGQALAMGRQVERALVRARVAAAGNLRRRACPVAPVVARLVATLRRLPDADSLSWEVNVPAALSYPGDEGDLTELLGNLLDNARKWAHRRVVVTGASDGSDSRLVIADDGPGMSAAAIARIARGRRWDETKPGTGFGLAISSDIAEETGGQVALGASELGGLQVALEWHTA
ncbi:MULTISPECIES: ATP-binding protein [Methylobacterium]|uniref:histidine kinase n=1 Tax=Methylobacterium thuringiense TaxID=1003091 RepID=A0ABQ4TUS1_9HYPH|nr:MULTISPECIES: HAMP domain-containing sensor histidine kinase [Methylobacterium]TXN22748.1 HAMP domain-containing histidine kinase [Methylobacterium sp. WL9]GJE57630.1 Sensor protein PhoQ [Methylobacterium thuringiense]